MYIPANQLILRKNNLRLYHGEYTRYIQIKDDSSKFIKSLITVITIITKNKK